MFLAHDSADNKDKQKQRHETYTNL